MIGPVFGIVGFLWGYYLARQRGGKTLDRLQYGVRRLRHRFRAVRHPPRHCPRQISWGGLIGETSPVLNSSPLCRLNL